MVTGASEGIGREVSRELAADGYGIVAVARNQARLDELLEELEGSGHTKIQADLCSDEDVARVSAELGSRHHHVLVNNAGAGGYGRFHEQDPELIERIQQLNIGALVQLAHAFLHQAREGDALVNLSSVLAFTPLPGQAVYAASKSFVTSFSDSLWHENRPRGVFVTGVCPGVTLTKFNQRAGGSDANIPKLLTQSSQQVARFVVKRLRSRRKPATVAGLANRMLVFATRLVTRKTVLAISSSFKLEVYLPPHAGTTRSIAQQVAGPGGPRRCELTPSAASPAALATTGPRPLHRCP